MIVELHSSASDHLVWLLRSSNDRGTPRLRVVRRDSAVGLVALEVSRHDGSELSAAEAARVRGVLARA